MARRLFLLASGGDCSSRERCEPRSALQVAVRGEAVSARLQCAHAAICDGGVVRVAARPTAAVKANTRGGAELEALTARLAAVNARLWEIEDDIRVCERNGDFGPDFVALARSVYQSNGERAAIKRAISQLFDSAVVEEKSYADPNDQSRIA